MIERERIEKFKASFERRAERCMKDYQETGITRYNTECYRLEDLAEICSLALSNHDDHAHMMTLKSMIGELASAAASGDLETLKKKALSYGRMEGFDVKGAVI